MWEKLMLDITINVLIILANIPGFLESFFFAITVLRRGPNSENVWENTKLKTQEKSSSLSATEIMDTN